jgi:choline dehydrogenase-like flavoprotein
MDGRHALLLRTLIDRLIPADEHPGALALGTDSFVLERLSNELKSHTAEVVAGLEQLDSLARDQFATAFDALSNEDRDTIIRACETQEWLTLLCDVTASGFYADPCNGGNADAQSWQMVRYRHGLPDGACGPVRQPDPTPRSVGPSEVRDYDVIVVGAGAGGAIAAAMLAKAGKSVLLLERGVERTYADSGHRDHLRNHRLSLFGHSTGPDLEGNPRVALLPDGTTRITRPTEYDYHPNAACVGSGTFVYGGMAWRFHPDDFRMASRYGVPEGSSLADWPIGYDDLAPWYEMAEWEIGVSGDGRGDVRAGLRARDFPMPPVAAYASAAALRRGAAVLGLSTFSPPLLINTVPRDGREACVECGTCVGFPCPSNAKNGTQNTMIPRALATGRVTLVTGAMAERIDTEPDGRVTGVTYSVPAGDALRRITEKARAVIVSCGAIETARLLLASASAKEPAGLGNGHDLVGRNLQGHVYPTVYGTFDEEVHDPRGPGVTIATTNFVHGNDGVIGGAMLADDFVMPPAIFWHEAFPPHLRRWGREAKDFMRREYRHVGQVKGPVHEIPDPTCRVTLASGVRDRFGLPVAQLAGRVHTETMRTANYIHGRAREWLAASGAKALWERPLVRRLTGHQHQAGTCRMGTDPATSVTDSYGRVWGHDNLFVADASLHPTNGAFNPVLTVMALAFRNASHIAASI